jgi:hypothetical protein
MGLLMKNVSSKDKKHFLNIKKKLLIKFEYSNILKKVGTF